MRTINKILLSALAGTTLANAVSFEYPTLYKDTRIMGMGGANIAVGGEASSLFYNPAGLSAMKYAEGFEIELLNISASFSENTLDLVSDIDGAATDVEMLDVLEAYQGANNHITINDFSSVSYRGQNIAWGVGVIAGSQLNFQTHGGGAGGLLELNGYALTGLVGGVSYDLNSNLSLGFGFKSLNGAGADIALSVGDLLGDLNFDDQLTDFSSSGVDFGAMYNLKDILPFGGYWQPMVGLSIMDLGDTELGAYATIPQTINLGFSVKPDFAFLSDWTLAFDYIDVTNALDTDYDADFGKKFRVGAQVSLLNNSWMQLTGKMGVYNTAPTYGIEARLAFLTLNLASYVEEVGAYAGQNIDRRTTVSAVIGW